MTDKDLIFDVMYFAFLDIRDSARQHDDNTSYHIANLFHNMPALLSRAADGETTYEQAMSALREKAKQTGATEWLDNVLETAQRHDSRKRTSPWPRSD